MVPRAGVSAAVIMASSSVSVVERCDQAVYKAVNVTDSRESEIEYTLESEGGLLTGALRSEISNNVLV